MSNILVYKGDGDHDETEVFGLSFKAGEAVEVDDAATFTRLSGNPMFRVPDGRSKEARAVKVPPAKPGKQSNDAAKERAAAHKAELEAAEAEKKAEEARLADEAKR